MTSHIKAPPARLVNAFDGKKAPEKYFQALSEADSLCAELDTLRESQTRVQELEAELAELRAGGPWVEHVERQRAMKRERDGECICNIVDGPDEFCPWHGRSYNELLEMLTRQQAENNETAEQLHDLDESHRITLAALAEARRGNTEPWHGQAVTS